MGVAGALLFQAVEFPVESVIAAAFGPAGLAAAALSDVVEMALVPLAVGAAHLSRRVPGPR